MKVLAVDSSTSVLSVALLSDGEVVWEQTLCQGKTHSTRITPMLDQLFRDTALTPADIDWYAAANGPGSFTGIRIGMATIKAMAQVAEKPVVCVDTLEGLAYRASFWPGRVCALLDARNGNVYAAWYRFEQGRCVVLQPPHVISVEELAELFATSQEPTVFVGDGASVYQERWEALPCYRFLPPAYRLPQAGAVAMAALHHTPGSFHEAGAFYISKPQAEREREEKQKKERTPL